MPLKFTEKLWPKTVSKRNSTLPFTSADDDVFLVSYPRSGNTWLRFLIASYLSGSKVDFFSVHDIMPDMHERPESIKQLKSRPRFIKSHFSYCSEMQNVIYLVRNVREVAVSYFHFHRRNKQISEDSTFEQFLLTFNQGNVGYGRWSDHLNSWIDHAPARFLLVRYEDLVLNPVGELIRMCVFSKIPVDLARIEKAVEQCSFENMSKLDAAQPRRGLNPTEKNKMFIREGGTDYSSYFTGSMQAEFMANHGTAMKRLGYV